MKRRITSLQTRKAPALRLSRRGLALAVGAFVLAAGLVFAWQAVSADPVTDPWVMHYFKVGSDDELQPYQDILSQLPDGASLTVVVPDERTEAHFRANMPDRPVRFVHVPHQFSPWARDRYVLFERRGKLVCLTRAPARVRPELRGDVYAGAALAKLIPDMTVEYSDLSPVGGDVILLDDVALIGSESVQRALAAGRFRPEQLEAAHERLLGRPVIHVDTAGVGPFQLHLDMVVGHAGGKRLVVGDTALAREQMGKFPTWVHPKYGRFNVADNLRAGKALDRMARLLTARGFEVTRAPVVFGLPTLTMASTVLSYTNVQTSGDQVFLPIYDLPELDRLARKGWEALGFEVMPVRCSYAITKGGAVRCLTNRIPTASPKP